jgi:hypothetical protein
MLEAFWGVVLIIVWMIDMVLSVMVTISRLHLAFGLGEAPAASAMETARQARLKILSPAAQRALAEAEQRRRDKRAASNSRGKAGERAP